MKVALEYKQVIKGSALAISLLAALSMTACGKKRKDEEPSKQTKVTVVPAKPTPAKTPAPTAMETADSGVLPVTKTDWTPVIKYDSLDPENVVRADRHKRLTGARDERGQVFTDASTDYLMTYLRMRTDAVTDTAVRERNLKFAANISDVLLNKDENGKVTLKVRLRTAADRSDRVATLTGNLADGRYAELKSESSTLGTANQVTAELRCVDLNQETCETSFLRIVAGQVGSRAYGAVVVRETDAKLHVALNTGENASQDFKDLRSILLNSMFDMGGDKLKTIQMQTWAVVNGRSSFRVKLVSEDNELLAFGGLLLAPAQASTAINLYANRSILIDDLVDEESGERRSTRINDAIEDIRIVNNNGLGQIKAKLTLGEVGKSEKQIVDVTILRVLKPILHMSEDSLYFEK